MGNSLDIISFRKRRKQNLVQLKGGKCCICGFDSFVEALEFHHINPEIKEYQLSSGHCHSLEKDINEVKKCALVCSNCHKGIHANKIVLPLNWDFIDEIFLQELISQNNEKQNFCKKCGVLINNQSTYCSKCNSIKRRVCERPDREELKEMIRIKSFLQIGKDFGVSDNAIRKWCKSYNLPFRVRDIKNLSNEEWEKI